MFNASVKLFISTVALYGGGGKGVLMFLASSYWMAVEYKDVISYVLVSIRFSSSMLLYGGLASIAST